MGLFYPRIETEMKIITASTKIADPASKNLNIDKGANI